MKRFLFRKTTVAVEVHDRARGLAPGSLYHAPPGQCMGRIAAAWSAFRNVEFARFNGWAGSAAVHRARSSMDGEEWQAHRRARGKQAGNGANGSGATNSSRPRRLLAPVLALALIALAACAGPGASGLGARASALVPTPTADAHPAASTSALTPNPPLPPVTAPPP